MFARTWGLACVGISLCALGLQAAVGDMDLGEPTVLKSLIPTPPTKIVKEAIVTLPTKMLNERILTLPTKILKERISTLPTRISREQITTLPARISSKETILNLPAKERLNDGNKVGVPGK